jgi:hypothetical protein
MPAADPFETLGVIAAASTSRPQRPFAIITRPGSPKYPLPLWMKAHARTHGEHHGFPKRTFNVSSIATRSEIRATRGRQRRAASALHASLAERRYWNHPGEDIRLQKRNYTDH